MPQQGGANASYTRLRGPLLVGQSSDFGVAAFTGGSTAPLISFWNASEFGYYSTSTAQARFTTPGSTAQGAILYTSGSMQIVSTAMDFSAASSFKGLMGSTFASGFLIIPQSTATMSSGTAPTNTFTGCPMIFVAHSTSGGKLWLFSTVTANWMASTLNFTTTST